ncbi:MAG: hypothetical protein NT091_05180, partial [Candidatus Falkowbacteria bacterium]|nr:hypothetical protein [Candidatus Falkowbacteria bacterium]
MDVQATATFSPVIPEQLAGEEETFKTVVPEHYMRKQVPPGGHEVHNDVITHPEYTDPMLEEVAAMPRLKNVVDIAPTIDQTNKDQRQDLEEYRQMAESVRETKRAMERKARIAGILTWNELMCQFREEEQGHFKCRQNVNRLTGELAECTGNLELCRQERQAFEAQVEQDKIAAAETANAEKQQAIEATKLEAAQKNEEDNQAKIDQILLDAAMESTKKGKKEDKTRTDKVLKAVADSVLSYGRKGRTQTEKLTDKMKIEGIIGKFDKGDPFKTLSAETLDNLRQFGWQSDGKKQTEEFITTALIATRTPQDNVALALDLSEHSRIDDYRKIIRDAREKGFVDPNGKTAFELKEGWKEDKNIEG